MLSTLVFVPPALPPERRQGALARTLAALVPAVIEGAVRDVTLLRTADGGDLVAVADEAGCRVAAGSDFAEALARGAAEARSPWVLVIQAGAAPTRLFGEEACRALERRPEARGGLVLRGLAHGGVARWIPAFARPVGVMLPRARLVDLPCAAFAEVVRRARPAQALPTPASVYR